MAEKTKEEIAKEKNSIERVIDNISKSIAENKRARANLVAKRKRLVAARDKVKSAKNDAKSIRRKEERCIDKKYKWRGQHKIIFDGDGYEIKAYNDSYISDVDDVHDALNNEIAQLDIQIGKKTGLLTTLGTKLNAQRVKLTNLIN